jgi:TM2 domain-containing membrane protein YozV
MNCAYHAEVPNVAFCIRCGHALCNQCVRNVRGSVYCETCLAEAVEGKSAAPPPPTLKREVIAGTNPGAAFALGLIPGVGAIYNGEFVKAAIHVLIFGTLISFAEFGPQPLVGLMIAAFVFYMPFEAYYTAKKRQLRAEQGIELETPIDRLQHQFGDVKDRELWGGVALIVLGGLYLLGNLDVFEMARVARFWPALLVVVGVWLLKKHQDKAE